MLTRLMILDGLPNSQFHLQDRLTTQNTVCSSVVLGRSVLVYVRVHMYMYIYVRVRACVRACVRVPRALKKREKKSCAENSRKTIRVDSRTVW